MISVGTKVLCVTAALMLLSGVAAAVEDVVVLGLFKNKAIVRIDGKRRVLSAGQTSPEGVRLISADSGEAVLEVGGERAVYPLGSHIGTQFSTPTAPEFQIWPDPQGMYSTVGSINGLPVRFMVDTGATNVAMNEAHARRLGIQYRLVGEEGYASTAAGVVKVYKVKLKTVKVGDIHLRNVDASVVEGGSPEQVLLGMSFLGRLEMRNEGKMLLLRQKY